MSRLKITGPKGHETRTWDPATVDESSPEAIAILEELNRVCAEHASRGAALFRMAPGEPVQIDEFDPRAEEIIVSVPLSGG